MMVVGIDCYVLVRYGHDDLQVGNTKNKKNQKKKKQMACIMLNVLQ